MWRVAENGVWGASSNSQNLAPARQAGMGPIQNRDVWYKRGEGSELLKADKVEEPHLIYRTSRVIRLREAVPIRW